MILLILFISYFVGTSSSPTFPSYTTSHIHNLRNQTQTLFVHGWMSYKNHGFPGDEVLPLSCQPYGPDFADAANIVRNDAMGNVSLTLIDTLDTLIVMEQWDELVDALDYVYRERATFFHQDTVVQVFEMTIRSVGSLLSTHLLLTDVDAARVPPEYCAVMERYRARGGTFLLDLAEDLGSRLLPAFKTTTGIPVPRINLARGVMGVPYHLQGETCTLGAATPVLELTLLSRLTGNASYEHYAQRAFWTVWQQRLDLDLVPMTISPAGRGAAMWKDAITGVGASVDSFYEYAAKAAIVLDDAAMWRVFTDSYRALLTHLMKTVGGGSGSAHGATAAIFANINTNDGLDATVWIDLLGAFWAGVQVLAGRVSDAIRSHMVYWKLIQYFDAIPERWNFLIGRGHIPTKDYAVGLEWYPLRPEFIESTYYLYRATRDPMLVHIGAHMVRLYREVYRAPCGFRGVQDVRSGEPQDRMESFVLSESLKYLYLLFDEEDKAVVHYALAGKSWVFSTEGHVLWLPRTGAAAAPVEESVTSTYSSTDAFFLSHCERVHTPPRILPISSYYEMSHFYDFDFVYRHYLHRPQHLPPYAPVELDRDFYDTFAMVDPRSLQCAVPATTISYDLFIGDKAAIKTNLVSRVCGGYSIRWFYNLRVSLEIMTLGSVESYGNVVTQEDLDHVLGSIGPEVSDDKLVRITRINGVILGPEDRLWVEEVPEREDGALKVVEGKLILNGMVVENVVPGLQ